jgi:uncharacterized protein (TIGR03000 family)
MVSYAATASSGQAYASTPAVRHAEVQVQLPADAKLYVEGQAVDLSTGNRKLVSPNLEPGRDYVYTVKAEAVRDGKTVSQTRQVRVRAGHLSQVDFGQLEEAAAARLTVRMPVDAKLFVDDVLSSLTGKTRSFETPKLEPGQTYAYTLRMEADRDGRTVSESKRVRLAAGKEVTVDFSETTAVVVAGR